MIFLSHNNGVPFGQPNFYREKLPTPDVNAKAQNKNFQIMYFLFMSLLFGYRDYTEFTFLSIQKKNVVKTGLLKKSSNDWSWTCGVDLPPLYQVGIGENEIFPP